MSLILTLLAGCGDRGAGPPPSTTPVPAGTRGLELSGEIYAEARAGFKTRLLRRGPSPGSEVTLGTPSEAVAIEYVSGTSRLKAFATPDPGDRRRRPAVLFLHGGFGFGEAHWEMARPFRDAGYVVLIPVLRGENGQRGNFTLFYDEVEDVLAAARALSALPYVDADRLYLAGHSVGGTLTMLAAMLPSVRFRAAASFSGSPDQVDYLRGRASLVPFDASDFQEFRLRSPVAFASSFRCPIRLFFGDEEYWVQAGSVRTALLAKRHGIDAEAVEVPGDHASSVPESIRRSIAFFRSR